MRIKYILLFCLVLISQTTTAQIPTIKSFNPSNICVGETVDIIGSNFITVSNVNIGIKPVLSYTIVNDTLIKAIIDTGINSGFIEVVNSTGFVRTNCFLRIGKFSKKSVYVGMSDGSMSIYNLSNGSFEKKIYVGGSNGMCSSSDQRNIYIPLGSGYSTISVLNTIANNVYRSITVQATPLCCLFNEYNNRIYVSNGASNSISVIDSYSNNIITTISVGNGPIAMALSKDGTKLFVANTVSNTLSVINTNTNNVITSVPIGKNPSSIVVNPKNNNIYVSNYDADSIYVLSNSGYNIIKKICVGHQPNSLAISLDGSLIYCSNYGSANVNFINTDNDSIVNTIIVGNNPVGISLDKDGQSLYIARYGDNKVDVLNLNTLVITNLISSGTYPYVGSLFVADVVNECPPKITSYSPSTTSSGNIITIKGHNFKDASSVTFGGVPAQFKIINSNTITATVNAGASGYLQVSTISGSDSVSGFVYTSPYIKSFSPSIACLGSLITINGFGFTGTTSVKIGSNDVSSFSVLNDTTINVIVGKGWGGVIKIIKPSGVYVSANIFQTGTNYKGTDYAYVGSTNDKAVSVINTLNDSVITKVYVGNDPRGVSISPDGSKAYVAGFGSNTVSVINTYNNYVTNTISVSTAPITLCCNPDGTRVYVANFASNSISVINAISNSVITTIAVGTKPKGLVVSPDGTRVYVINSTSNNLSIINTLTNSVIATLALNTSPEAIVISPDGSKLYISSNSNFINVVNTATNTIINNIPFIRANAMAISPDGYKLYATVNNNNELLVLNTITNTVIGSVSTILNPSGISVSSDGSKIYINSNGSGVGVVDANTLKFINSIPVNSGVGSIGNFIAKQINGCPITLSSFFPTTASKGSILTIKGTNFSNVNLVRFGSTNASSFTIVNDSTITAILGNGSTGQLIVSDGNSTASIGGFKFSSTSITSFYPQQGCSGTVITIKGNNLYLATAVSIGGSSVSSFTIVDSSTITAIIGKGANGFIKITTPLGIFSSNQTFLFTNTFNSLGYITNYSSSSVSVVNTTTDAIIATIRVKANPSGTNISPDKSKVYILTYTSIDVINTSTNSVITSIAFSSIPKNMCFSQNGQKAYIIFYNSNQLSIVDTKTNSIINNITVGTSPSDLSLNPDGDKLYVTNTNSNDMSVINTSTDVLISTIPLLSNSYPTSFAISPDGTKMYVISSNLNAVSIYGLANGNFLTNIPIASAIQSLVLSPDGDRVYVTNIGATSSLYVINTVFNNIIAQIILNNLTGGLGINTDGSKVYIPLGGSTPSDYKIAVFNANNNTVSKYIPTYSYYLYKYSIANIPEIPCPPSIYSFTPQSSPAGGVITINGSSLNNATSVSFGGVSANSFTVVDDTTIKAVVGNGASGNVMVTTLGGTATLNGFICSSPYIKSFSPLLACKGTQLTIKGGNFTGLTSVNIDSVDLLNINVVNDSTVTGIFNGNKSGFIKVITPNGTSFSPVIFSAGSNYKGNYGYIANYGNNTVSVINLDKDSVISTFNAGSGAKYTAISPDGSTAYISNYYGQSISVINTSNNIVKTTISIGVYADGLAVTPDGKKVFVTNSNNNTVTIIDVVKNLVVKTFSINSPTGICFSSKNNVAYITNYNNSTISVVDITTNAILKTINVGSQPFSVSISPDGNLIYVVNSGGNSISAINTNNNTLITTIQVGTNPYYAAFSPDGNKAYVTNQASNTISVINTVSNKVIATIPGGSTPEGISCSSDGSKIYVTNYNDNSVSVIDTNTNSIIKNITVGNNPISIGNFITKVPIPCQPTISSFTPKSNGLNGTVIIYGSNFTSTNSVSFGGVNAKSFTVLNDTTIIAVVGKGLSGEVRVITAGGSVSLAGFIYTTPMILSFSPTTGCVGSLVTLKGINFQNVNSITIGGVQVPSIIVNDSTTISFNAINNSGKIAITTSNGVDTSAQVFSVLTVVTKKINLVGCDSVIYNNVTYKNSTIVNDTIKSTGGCDSIYKVINVTISCLPSISDFSPNAGCDGTEITITGLNFIGVSTVSIGGVAAKSFSVLNSTTLKAIVDSNISGNISVTTTYGNVSSNATFWIGGKVKSFAYIANRDDSTVSVIDLLTNSIVATIKVGIRPFGVCVSPDMSKVYVANSGSNNISVINTATNTVITTIAVGSVPYGLVVNPNGSKLYVTNFSSNSVAVINTQTNVVETNINVGIYPVAAAISPDGTKLYISNYYSNTVSVVNTATNTVSTNISVGSYPIGLICNPSGSQVYVANTGSNSISVINTSNGNVNSFPAGLNPEGIASDLTGSNIYITNNGDSTVSVFNTNSNSITNTISVGKNPLSASISFDGKFLYVTNFGSNTVSFINLTTNTLVNNIAVGKRPSSLGNFVGGSLTPIPSSLIASNNGPVNVQDSIKLSLSGNNLSGSVFNWTGPHNFSSSSLNPIIPSAQPIDSGTYTVQVITGNCTSKIQTTLVTINPSFKITGYFKSIKDSLIKRVTVSLNGVQSLNNQSYSFIVNPNIKQTIKPYKNNDYIKSNGINTTDVLFVQRHILNTAKLNSAYKLIAADVTGDGKINSTDVLRIKRLILGTDTTFTKTVGTIKTDRLWEFVDSSYIFPDTTNPFPFKDSISFTNLTNNKTNQTFIGIKLGDVNYSWDATVARPVMTNPIEFVYTIKNDGSLIKNSLLKIPISVNQFKDLVAMQFTLHYNNQDYEFVRIENNHLYIDYNDKFANNNGNISFVWTDNTASEKTIPNGSELFTLVLRLKNFQPANLKIEINSEITEIAAWDKDLIKHIITLRKRFRKLEDNCENFSISPNPTDGEIGINLFTHSQRILTFELSDLQGKKLLQESIQVEQGSSRLTINLNKRVKLPSGLYFLLVNGIDGENVKQLVVK